MVFRLDSPICSMVTNIRCVVDKMSDTNFVGHYIDGKTPELDKVKSVSEKSQSIGEFLDFMINKKKIKFCQVVKEDEDREDTFPRYAPVPINLEILLAEFFKINLNKAEKERRAILEAIREDRRKAIK